MNEVSTLAVLTTRGQPMVQAELDGTPVAFVVDTGAASSTISSAAADKIGLQTDYDRRASLGGVGGNVFVYATKINRLSFGTAEARDQEFWRVEQPPFAVGGLPVGGLFGADFLSNYDVLFDLPNGRIRLFHGQNCDGPIVPPLSDPLVGLPFDFDDSRHIIVPARVDDHPIEAILDSGAGRTVLNLDDAHAAGVTQAMLDADRRIGSSGIDGRHLNDFLHEFRSLAIGDETRRPALLAVSDIVTPTLLGDDFFRRNQVWISYPHRMVFFHPVGAVQVLPSSEAARSAPGAAPRPAAANGGAR